MVGLLCAVLLVLAGCVKVDLDLEVHSDDTISGTMLLGVSKELPNAQQAVEQLKSQLPPDVTTEPWSDDKFVGVSVTYEDTPIDEFSTPTATGTGGDTGLGLRREGDFFIMGSPDAEESGSPDLSGLQPSYRVKLTFPGPVVEGNGTIDGNSIEWTDMDITPYVKARATSALIVPILIGVGVVLILAAAALLVVLMVRRNRSPQPAASTTGAWSGQPGPQPGGHDPTQFTGASVDQSAPWGAASQDTPPPEWDQSLANGGYGQSPPDSYGQPGVAWGQPDGGATGQAGGPWEQDSSDALDQSGSDTGESPWQRPT